MGSSCSMHQRQQHYEYSFRNQQSQRRRRFTASRKYGANSNAKDCGRSDSMFRLDSNGTSGTSRSSFRHSVISSIPDSSIAALFPKDENYIRTSHNRRSPKSLSELACDAVCRSLPDLAGEGCLPRGLPQDVVNDIFQSLIEHSALNATTLRALKNCELYTLPLSNCRGVTDEWFESLRGGGNNTVDHANVKDMIRLKGINNDNEAIIYNVLSSTGQVSFIPSTSIAASMIQTDTIIKEVISRDNSTDLEMLGAEDYEDRKSSNIFYRPFDDSSNDHNHDCNKSGICMDSSSSCSTSSFVSATSNHHHHFNSNSCLMITDAAAIGTSENDGDIHHPMQSTSDRHTTFIQSVDKNLHDSRSDETAMEIECEKKEEDRRPSIDETEVSSDTSTKASGGDCDCPHERKAVPSPEDNSEKKSSSSFHCTTTSLPLFLESSVCFDCDSYSNNDNDNNVTSNVALLDLRGCQHITDRGLLQLTDLSCLEIARLDNCHSIKGRGLLAFANSHRLHTISMVDCRRLSDEAAINISHILSLESLSLEGCRCVTDRSLVAISALINLKKLDLSQCDLITDEGIEQLEHLEKLEEVNLGWCRSITDQGVDMLTSHPGRKKTLRRLQLTRCTDITDIGIGYLSRLHHLEELDLNGCHTISSAVLGDTLGKLKHLTTLDVSYCPGILRTNWQGKINSLKTLQLCYSGVRDNHITQFSNLSALQELNLDSCSVGDSAIQHLADNDVVPNLLSLNLADTNLTDLGMSKIAKFTKLTHLSLFYCSITDNSLRHISKLYNLEVLNLDSRDISDEGLCHLRDMTNLRALDIFSGRITDTGCFHLAKITSLESLELCGGGIGDSGCTLLAGLENLTCLNLSQNERITNRGAAALATLSNLKALNLSHTRVNASALRFFSSLRQLQSIALYGCLDVEDDERAIENLQDCLPNLKCIRSQRSSDQEGMVVVSDDEDYTDECDDDSFYQEHNDSSYNNNKHLSKLWAEASSAASARQQDHMDEDEEASEYSDHD